MKVNAAIVFVLYSAQCLAAPAAQTKPEARPAVGSLDELTDVLVKRDPIFWAAPIAAGLGVIAGAIGGAVGGSEKRGIQERDAIFWAPIAAGVGANGGAVGGNEKRGLQERDPILSAPIVAGVGVIAGAVSGAVGGAVSGS